MTRNLICSECGGELKRGFVSEVHQGYVHYGAPFWIEGTVERNTFWGTVKTKGKKKFHTITYRCESCGFLKSYAGPNNSLEKQE